MGQFILGFMIGAYFGIFVISLLVVSKESEEK